jgi:hypothetical protein
MSEPEPEPGTYIQTDIPMGMTCSEYGRRLSVDGHPAGRRTALSAWVRRWLHVTEPTSKR